MSDPPAFGILEPGREYEKRPSAYAIVTNAEGRIAVVKTPRGCYLPGGGLEPGEDAETAVARECLEECGFRPQQLSYLASAVQLLFAAGEGWFRIEGDFYSGQVADAFLNRSQHVLEWVDPSLACELMTRPFESWAIQTWMRR